jgi:hypothetical protein
MLYVSQNNIFDGINFESTLSRVMLPLDINDADLLTGNVPEQVLRPTQMTYFLLHHQLDSISAKICDALFRFPSGYPVGNLEAEIFAVLGVCERRYQVAPCDDNLPLHHLAAVNILYSYCHHLLLLIHRPGVCRYLQGHITRETHAAWTNCIASAKVILSAYQIFHNTPGSGSYKWSSSGNGSFYAFHALVILSLLTMIPSNQFEIAEVMDLLRRSTLVFVSFSKSGRFCGNAVPVIGQIM